MSKLHNSYILINMQSKCSELHDFAWNSFIGTTCISLPKSSKYEGLRSEIREIQVSKKIFYILFWLVLTSVLFQSRSTSLLLSSLMTIVVSKSLMNLTLKDLKENQAPKIPNLIRAHPNLTSQAQVILILMSHATPIARKHQRTPRRTSRVPRRPRVRRNLARRNPRARRSP